jgi:hypothetical protein
MMERDAPALKGPADKSIEVVGRAYTSGKS